MNYYLNVITVVNYFVGYKTHDRIDMFIDINV